MTMQFQSDYTALFTVTDRLGIDLAAAIRDGSCTPAELSTMMGRCSDCWHSRKCAQWQHETRGTPQDSMAAFCPSAEDLAVLVQARETASPRRTPNHPISLAAARGRVSTSGHGARA